MIFVFLVMVIPLTTSSYSGNGCDAETKFKTSDYLPTLSSRDTTGMYSYLPPKGEGVLKISYLKYPLNFIIKFDFQNESKMINSKGDLLEVVVTPKDNPRSFFFIKGELLDPTKSGFTDTYFRVRFYNENEYIFRFGQEPNYKYALFLRDKMNFCKEKPQP